MFDDKQVEIPALFYFVSAMEGRRRQWKAHGWKSASKQSVRCRVKCLPPSGQAVMGSEIVVSKFLMSHCQEKLLLRKVQSESQTDTGVRGEYPQVSERTLVVELGKMTPSLRKKGC